MFTVPGIRARRYSLLTAVLLTAQAAGGLFIPGLYRDQAWVASVLRGQDFVALVLVVPLLIAAHIGSARGSARWHLVWLGVLYKVFYNNLYYVANGQVPQLVIDGGGGTHLVAALDLTMIVPLMLVSGWLLWRSRPWGRVLAPAMLVQSTLIVVDLVVTPAFQAAAGIPDAWAMLPVWVTMGAAFLLGAGLLLRSAPSRS